MPLTDRYDNPVRTRSDAAQAAYVRGVDHILGATYGAVEAFEDAAAADPGFALAHAGLARARMFAGDMAGAKAAIAAAQALPADDARTASHVETLALLLAGRAAEATQAARVHVAEHPRDTLIAQMLSNVFGLIGFSGCTGRESDLYAYTAALLPHYGDDWWMMSMHALSMCEIGELDRSLDLMGRSLEINPGNGNAAHFKAHALYELNRTDDGIRYVDGFLGAYDLRGPLTGHLAWHRALWSLLNGDYDGMWQITDRLNGPLPINKITDTVAILYRAELAGVEVDPARWQAMSDYAAQKFPQPGQSFVDLHSTLAHAKAGQGDRLAPYLDTPPGFAGDLVAQMARCWKALAAENWQQALDLLTPVMADHVRLGGSRAQRDLLEFAWVGLLIRLGRAAEARTWLRVRRPHLAEGAPVAGLH